MTHTEKNNNSLSATKYTSATMPVDLFESEIKHAIRFVRHP